MKEFDEVQDVMAQLETLAPQEADRPTAPALMLARIKNQTKAHEAPLIAKLRRYLTMNNRKFALGALAALVVLVVAFSLPPVRAAASDFLGLFRVQKFAAVSISPRQMALLEQVADEGLHPGEFQSIEEPAPPQAVATIEEASELSGIYVYAPQMLGAPTRIEVSGQGSGRLTVDLDNARRILQAAELDPQLLPDSLDGAEIDVTIFPAVHQNWESGVRLLQSASPLIDYPDDVDPNVMGAALLQMLGMSSSEAQRLASSIDWSSTLLLPVPEDLATFREVTVNGVSALELTSLEGKSNSLLWQQDGIIFMLVGSEPVETLLKIAESIQ